MIIYSNGCSHTASACTLDTNDSHIRITAKSLMGDYTFIKNPTPSPDNGFSYNEVLSTINNNKNYLIFESEFGKSNDRIFHESVNFLFESILRNKKIDLAVVQWSGPNRRMTSGINGEIIDINMFDNTDLGIKLEPLASCQTLQYMIILQELYKKFNIEYVFIPYMETDEKVSNTYYNLNRLDTSRLTCSPTVGHRNNFRKNNLCCDTQGHPNQLGSYLLSSMTLDIIGLSDSLIGIYDYFGETLLPNFGVSPVSGERDFIKKFSHILKDGTENIIDFIREKLE